MKSQASSRFWALYRGLPPQIRKAAAKQYRLWMEDPHHPSVQFKKVRNYWSARVTDDYRALGVMQGESVIWFWIGTHDDYEQLLRRA